MEYQFTIIIPVYNESETIFRLEKECLQYLKIASKTTQVLFINDGSTDTSLALIKTICERNKSFSFIHLEKNQGLSAAIKAGFEACKTPLVGYIDADLQTQPSDFNALLQYSDTYSLVTGIRNNRQDNLFKKITSKTANTLRHFITQDGITDTGCPLKVFQTNIAKQLPYFDGFHRFFPALIHLKKGTIKQVPIHHFPRLEGQSKFGFWNRFFQGISNSITYLKLKK